MKSLNKKLAALLLTITLFAESAMRSWLHFKEIKPEQIVRQSDIAGMRRYIQVYLKANGEYCGPSIDHLLALAASLNDMAMVTLLLSYTKNINAFQYDNTALMEAVQHDNIDMVNLLLNHGADVNIQNRFGFTALMFATRIKDVEMLQLLLDSGADISLQTTRGETALDFAKRTKNYDIITLLENYHRKYPAATTADDE